MSHDSVPGKQRNDLQNQESATVSVINLILGDEQSGTSYEETATMLVEDFGAEILEGEPNSPEFIEQLKRLYSPRDWTLHVREAILQFCGKYGKYPPAAVFQGSVELHDEWNETLMKSRRKHPQRTAQLMLQSSYSRIITLHRHNCSPREIANYLDCRPDAVLYAINDLIRHGYLPEPEEQSSEQP